MDLLGTVVKDIPPGENNPRNSEGGFAELTDGSLLFIYSRFTGESGHDDSPSDLVALKSYDAGRTWNDAGVVITAEEHGARNVMSVSIQRMQNGDLGLFYVIRAGANDARTHLKRSADEGLTWTEAEACIEPPQYFVVNNDRVVRLSSGRWVIPGAFHRNGYSTYDKARKVKFDARGVSLFYVSDDDGRSWRESKAKCAMPFNRHSNAGLQEPGLVELRNGVLWAWARTDLGAQWEMFSFDNAESWTSPEPSRFTSPCSPLSLKYLPGTDILVAVWNPIPNYNGRAIHYDGAWTGGRTPLVVATSGDQGNTWSEYAILEDDPQRGFCYTAMHFTGSDLLLAYCAGGVDDGGCLNRLRIRSIPISDLPKSTQ